MIVTIMKMNWRTKGISLNLKKKPGAGEPQKRAKPIGAWTETVVTLETTRMLFGKFRINNKTWILRFCTNLIIAF